MDWMIFWTAVYAIATVILASSVGLAIWQIIITRKNTNAQITVDLFREFRSDEEVELFRLIYNLKENFIDWTEEEKKIVGHICDMHEMLGALVIRGVIDKRLAVEAFAGRPALRCWYKLCNYVRKLQNNRGYYAEWYEAFTRLCLDHFRKVHLEVKLYGIDILAELDKPEFKPRNWNDIQKDRRKGLGETSNYTAPSSLSGRVEVMTIEEQLAALDRKVDDHHKEAARKSKGDRYENMSLILWGVALAAAGLALAVVPPYTGTKLAAIIVLGMAAILFSVLATIATVKLRKFRSWRSFWGD